LPSYLPPKAQECLKVAGEIAVLATCFVLVYVGSRWAWQSFQMGIPIAFALSLTGVIFAFTLWGPGALSLLISSAWGTMNNFTGGHQMVTGVVLSLPGGRWVVLAAAMLFILFLGMFLEPTAMIMLAAPILSPILQRLGFDSLWWGLLFMVMLQVAYLSPPFGFTLPEGRPLRQTELAQELEVSHIPIREVFRGLESEGLIEVFPNRGAVVAGLGPDDISEIFEIRKMLETGALRLACPFLTPPLLRRCETWTPTSTATRGFFS
jgi:hypothetical protein